MEAHWGRWLAFLVIVVETFNMRYLISFQLETFAVEMEGDV